MFAAKTALVLLSVGLIWAAINRAGRPSGPWFISVLLAGIALFVCGVWVRSSTAAKLPQWVSTCLSLLVAYIAFQFVPLPLGLLRVLSPARASLAQAAAEAAGHVSAAPIAVAIPDGLLWFATLLTCLAVFFAIKQLSFALIDRVWWMVIPLMVLGLFESGIGLLQVGSGADQATGTFTNRDHYGCLLEMILPVSVSCGLVLMRRTPRKNLFGAMPAIAASLCWIVSVVVLLGIFASVSRGATMAALFGLCFLAVAEVTPRLPRRRVQIGFVAGIAVAALIFLAFTAPAALQERFASTLSKGSESRLDIWRESMPLARRYLLFGIGLKSFQPVFEKYQDVALRTIVNYAHNDYLEYFEELGLIGFTLLAAFVAGVVTRIFAGQARRELSARRTWCAGCAASLAALMLHSAFDFNLYEPANVMTACWIAGFGYFIGSVPASGHRPMQSR